MKKRNLKKGFTIVELVIVIAVIAILSAVLIPTFGGVVADAKEAALKADAKAIYTEYVAWASENGEDVETQVYVEIEDKYYLVDNGVLADENIEGLEELPTVALKEWTQVVDDKGTTADDTDDVSYPVYTLEPTA